MPLPPDDGRPWRLDLADSEIGAWRPRADGWTLHLAVACLRPLRPRLGAGDETLWWPGVRIDARGTVAPGDTGPGRGRITGARVRGPDPTVTTPGALPWQAHLEGPWHCTLQGPQGACVLEAQALRITLEGPEAGRPSMAC